MKKIAILLLIFVGLAFSAEYHVDKEAENLVVFFSDAPIEDIEGKTKSIDGYVKWQGDDVTSESDFYIEVDLRTFETGIGLRDRHMRDNYLETDKFPFASYKGKIVKADTLENAEYAVALEGVFNLHGVEKNVMTTGMVRQTDKGYQFSNEFNLKLTDHDITIPQMTIMKVSNDIKITVNFSTKPFSK